jgi:ATP-dependent DNA helicase RecG
MPFAFLPFLRWIVIFVPMSEQSLEDKLTTPVRFIKGIGPKRSALLRELGILTVRDLLYYFPRGYLDLSRVEKIGNLRRVVDRGQLVTVVGTVRAFDLVGRPPRQRLVVILADETGTVPLVFFQSLQYFKKAFAVGETIAVSGKVSQFQNRLQFVHPSIDRLAAGDDEDGALEGFLHTGGIVPLYRSSEDLRSVKLDTRGFRRVLKVAVEQFIDHVEEFIPTNILAKHGFQSLPTALRGIHFPESEAQLQEARRRLKFDELFFLELLLAVRRKVVKIDSPGISFTVQSPHARLLVDSLPFKLTKAQIRVIKEIAADMQSARPMNRLLQGDVGSGKTIVALSAMLVAVDNGHQAAFMAPTEILAEQHYRTFRQFLCDVDVNVRLLIGGQRKTLREDVLEDVRRGSAQIIVGTHALIQEQVEFSRLGLVIVDEQHRFGVAQRLALREKGYLSHGKTVHPDVLVMTATPIPRTLSLTIYGDLDVSVIDEMPANRKPIKTILRTESERESVYRFLREEISKGRQAYVVFPLVEESEKVDLKAATEGYDVLSRDVFPRLRLGLIHGRLPSDEKDSIMDAFKNAEIDILVSTTVIEVGIDIPNAAVMVIEHAERFGLSQLHQLRGRVGRGAEQSYCILMAPDWMSRIEKAAPVKGVDEELEERRRAETRLRTMLQTTDGFRIAEVDLQLRGPGEFFGTRQSGFPEFLIANLLSDGELLAIAREEAFRLIDSDPQLRVPENASLRRQFAQNCRHQMNLLHAG